MTALVKACSKAGLIQLSPQGSTLRHSDSLLQKEAFKRKLNELQMLHMKNLMTKQEKLWHTYKVPCYLKNKGTI